MKLSRRIFFLCLVSLTGIACDQRPIDVAPDVTGGTWQVVSPEPENYLTDIAGISGSEIYAAWGCSGLLMFDGSEWSKVEGVPFDCVRDVFASPECGVYIIADNRVYRKDGGSWTAIYDNSEKQLFKIWVSSPTDIHLSTSNGMIHFDGNDWTFPAGTEEYGIYEMWGATPTDVFAVGDNRLIAHYDGAEWSEMEHDEESSFISVWGAGSSDVYATTSRDVWHYDGMEWSMMEVPSEFKLTSISKVWGISGNNVYFLDGYYGDIARFDGSEWEMMTSNTAMQLRSIWGPDPGDLYAVGAYGKIIHFDGVEWRSVAGGAPTRATFITGIDGQSIYVGDTRTIFYFDGAELHELPNTRGGLETVDLWARSTDDLVSVGGEGKVFRFDGTIWNRLETPFDDNLLAVSGIDDGSMVVVGENNTVLVWNGSQWSVPAPVGGEWADNTWRDVWMASSADFFMVGDSGSVARYNDGVWKMYTLDSPVLYSIWGMTPEEIIVGGQGAIYRFDGSKWERMPYPNNYDNYPYYEDFSVLSGTGMTNVYYLDCYRIAYHFDGIVWSPIGNDDDYGYIYIEALWVSPDNKLYAIAIGRHEKIIYQYIE